MPGTVAAFSEQLAPRMPGVNPEYAFGVGALAQRLLCNDSHHVKAYMQSARGVQAQKPSASRSGPAASQGSVSAPGAFARALAVLNAKLVAQGLRDLAIHTNIGII